MITVCRLIRGARLLWLASLASLAAACGAQGHVAGDDMPAEDRICALRSNNSMWRIRAIRRWRESDAEAATRLLKSAKLRCWPNAALTAGVHGTPREAAASIETVIADYAGRAEYYDIADVLIGLAYAACRADPALRTALTQRLWQMTTTAWWTDLMVSGSGRVDPSVTTNRAAAAVLALAFVGSDEATERLVQLQGRPENLDAYYQSYAFKSFVGELIQASRRRTAGEDGAPYCRETPTD